MDSDTPVGEDARMSALKRQRIEIDDERGDPSEVRPFTNCNYCDSTILARKTTHWSHMKIHQLGTDAFDLEEIVNPERALFPWYMHSLYQDTSINRSRFEPIMFTELSREAQCFKLEQQITKPFKTHFWIDYEAEKTDDQVKNYFAINPQLISKAETWQRPSACSYIDRTSHQIYCEFV